MSISSNSVALSNLRSKVNKAYKGKVSSGAKMRRSPTTRISTGSLALDLAAGVEPGGSGGLPIGQITMFLGERSSGKTTVTLKVIANAQRMCSRCYRLAVDVKPVRLLDAEGNPVKNEDGDEIWYLTGKCDCYTKALWAPRAPEAFKTKEEEKVWNQYLAELKANSFDSFNIVYLDVENALDLQWAAWNGVFLETMEHIIPGYGEQGIDLADEFVKSGVVDLLVIDSIAALVPSKEIEESSEDWQQGLQARLVNKMVRKVVGSSSTVRANNDKFVTQIWINQFREKIGAQPGAGKTRPGGKGQGFATSVEFEFWKSDPEEEVVHQTASLAAADQMKQVTRVRINFKNVKNKTAKAEMKGSFKMSVIDRGELKASSVIEQEYILKLAMSLGLVTKISSAKYTFRGREFTSQSAINAMIVGSPEVLAWTKATILDTMAGHRLIPTEAQETGENAE
jgi:recombination protein RecA